MTHAAVPKSFSRILLACAVCLFFGSAVPAAFAQTAASHGGGGQASASMHSGGGSFGGHFNGGHAAVGVSRASASEVSAGRAQRASSNSAYVSDEGNRSARFYGASGARDASVASAAGQASSQQNAKASARFFGASSVARSSDMGGTGAVRGENAGESPAGRGFTRAVFAAPAGQDAAQQNVSGRASPNSRYVTAGNPEVPSIEMPGDGRAQVIVKSSVPVRYELVGGEWVVAGAQQQRPGYRPPADPQPTPQAPSPIVSPPRPGAPMQTPQAPRPIGPLPIPSAMPPAQPLGTPVGTAQQQRPVYTPPRPAQAPRPIMTPPSAVPARPATPPQNPVRPTAQPIPQNPIRPVGTPANPASPPIARMPGQQPVVRFPIAQPPAQRIPIQPMGGPAVPVTPPMVRIPGQPVMHFPMVRPPIGRMRLPGTPAFHPPLAPPAKSPLFHPVVTLPGRMPIRRIGEPVARGPFAFAGGAPPIRKIFDGTPRNGGPFIFATPQPPHFDAHPCFQTITNCGFGFGFGGDFDFDDGFFFGFPFGSPFFFGPFGFPIFDLGPQCFFNGIVEPCAFTPLGFAQFQAFGPNGWGWSWLGWGNGWFYSQPEPPPPPPWNSTETNPGLNLQYFTNEWYVPYSEPGAMPQAGAAPNENEQGVEQNQNVVTEIVTTDELVFGVTSYWMEDNQLCYVTTYNIKNCIPMSRVDLQKTVDMNYKRGVKFTLSPRAPDSQKPQPPDAKLPDQSSEK